jgi:hypothetical protein
LYATRNGKEPICFLKITFELFLARWFGWIALVQRFVAVGVFNAQMMPLSDNNSSYPSCERHDPYDHLRDIVTIKTVANFAVAVDADLLVSAYSPIVARILGDYERR